MSGAAPPSLFVSSNGFGAVSDANLNSLMQSGAVVSQLQAFVGLSNMTVFIVGTATPNDGGQGVFVWNATSTQADDGGVTCVAPFGLLAGRWLRLLGASGQVTSVPNIAALRALGTGATPVWVEGYYTAGDGGEGMFNIGTTASDNSGTIILSGNGTYYRDVQAQWYSVLWFGAKNNGSFDSAEAIQGCIDYCIANSVGPVWFPPGNGYKCSVGITVTGNGLRLIGGSTDYSLVQALTPNFNLLTISGSLNTIENMWWDTPGIPTAVSTVQFEGCVQCKIIDSNISGSYIPCQFTGSGADNMIFRSKFINSYGTCQVSMVNSSGQYFYRGQFDQPYPAGPPGQANLLGGWTANTAVTGVDVMTLNGYNIQVMGGGATGATPPTVASYGTNFTDGTVTWQLASPIGLVGVNVDSGSDANFFINCDFTGAYLYGLHLTNSASATGPQKTWVKASEFGEFLSAGVQADAGAGLLTEGCTFDNGVESGCAGVFFNSSWTGDSSTEGCLFTGGLSYGVSIGGGTNALVSGNQIYGCTASAIFVGENVNQFTLTNNQVGQSGTWGTNAHAITVTSGTSNFYVITGNNTAGASVGISDGGSGGDKYVAGNI